MKILLYLVIASVILGIGFKIYLFIQAEKVINANSSTTGATTTVPQTPPENETEATQTETTEQK